LSEVICQGFDDSVLLPPGSVLTGGGEMYKVFTPFKNAFIRRLREALPACVAAPKARAGGAAAAAELNYPQTPFDGLLFAADEKRRWRGCARFVSNRRRIMRGSATSRRGRDQPPVALPGHRGAVAAPVPASSADGTARRAGWRSRRHLA
jgi:hypothetical protein